MSDFAARPVFEIQLAKNANALADYFRTAFEKKFGVTPRVEGDDVNALREVVEHFKNDLDRCKALVDIYFTLQDKEFVENGYTVFWLRRKLNKVLIAFGQRNASLGSARTLMVRSWIYCANAKCPKPNYGQFEIICKASELDKAHYCRRCADMAGATSLEVPGEHSNTL